MARNGAGIYQLPLGQPVATGSVISAPMHNALMTDVATALTMSLAVDGQTPMQAALPMGGFKITGLAAATNAGEAVRHEQVGALALLQGAADPALTVARTSGTGSAAVPTGTTAQRDGTPVTGYFRYNTTLAAFEGYSGTVWGSVGGGATGAGGDTVFVENSRVMNTSYTLSTGKSASMVGPLTVATGVTLTIPTGQRLVVL